MSEIYMMNAAGKCEDRFPPTRPITPIKLAASVGPGGQNLPGDVRKIQNALNFVLPEKGGPLPKLSEDGIYQEPTASSITKFQIAEFGSSDFIVLPDSPTIERLAKYKGGLTSGSRRNIIAALSEALTLIKGAQANLTMAVPFVGTNESGGRFSSLSRDARMLHANRHFEIDKTRSPAETLQKVLRVYDTMVEIFNRPGGLWGPSIFDLDPLGHEGRAYAFGGGYFRNGVRDPHMGNIRKDSIYLCEKLDRDPLEKCAHTIVHELAHFVGSAKTFEPISDHENGYGWYDNPCLQRLTPEDKVSNADNYANFAFDLKYGRPAFSTQP